jgi:hypothetical protein
MPENFPYAETAPAVGVQPGWDLPIYAEEGKVVRTPADFSYVQEDTFGKFLVSANEFWQDLWSDMIDMKRAKLAENDDKAQRKKGVLAAKATSAMNESIIQTKEANERRRQEEHERWMREMQESYEMWQETSHSDWGIL